MPPKGEGGRCRGNDKTYAITRPLALGHEVLTDVAELQAAGLENPGAAWALASALRESLSRRLGIETRELGLSVARRQAALGTPTHSIFLYDLASGGAGYSPRLLDDLAGLLREAHSVLTCKLDCERGCSACVLMADLYAQQEIIDRQAALAFLAPLLAALANPEDEDVAAPGSVLSASVADALSRRFGPGTVATIFANVAPDLSVLVEQPFVALFADAERNGSTIRLALPSKVIGDLDEAQRFGLRNAAQRYRFELGMGATPVMPNGASMIAAIETSNEIVGWFSRDQSATLLGEGWGIGSVHPVISAPLTAPPIIEAVDPELLERKPQLGDRVKILTNDPGRPLRQFGVGLVGRILNDELEAIGLWKPGKLAELTYSDRYLKAPLPLTLLMRTVAGLRDALAPKDAIIRLSITTSRIGEDYYRGGCRRLRDNWPNDDARTDVVFALADYFGFDAQYDDSGAPHARKLTIAYDDGSSAVLLFDQGFGYWRAQGNDQHNFQGSAAAQARSLADSPAFIIGKGETYVAIKRG